mmetsp:Transcript_7446/g.10655  ORF Transcript_7446/g.10655 Transcript_7446/m.10655 type:complete len:188 (+) Transcript_7446:1248-1811(+)
MELCRGVDAKMSKSLKGRVTVLLTLLPSGYTSTLSMPRSDRAGVETIHHWFYFPPWCRIQYQNLRLIVQELSGQAWMSTLMVKIWKAVHQVCRFRKSKVHSNAEEEGMGPMFNLNARMIQEKLQGAPNSLDLAHLWIKPLSTLLNYPATRKIQWLISVTRRDEQEQNIAVYHMFESWTTQLQQHGHL